MTIDSYLANLNNERETMSERVIQWANVNTGSFNLVGLDRMAILLTEAFSTLKCEGSTISLPSIEVIDEAGFAKKIAVGPLLRFWKRPLAPIQVLLVGHMDTVFGLDHSFQKADRKTKDIIIAPGVSDMKGGLCVMLEALKTFEQSNHNQQLGWEVLINPDEEIGSLGSATFLEERSKFHQVGLLFEPAMNEQGLLAGERKGSGRFTIIVHGRAAHAGRDFFQGRNAITELAQIVTKIDALNGKREGVTINVGQIQGGGAINVVPELAICRLEIRTFKKEDEAWVQENLHSILSTVNQKEGFKAEVKGKFNRKPKSLVGKTKTLYEFVASVGEEIDQSILWQPSGGCCDGNNLFEAGLPNVDTLGVCGGKIHSHEEYLLVDSLVSRAKLTALILLRLSEGKFKN